MRIRVVTFDMEQIAFKLPHWARTRTDILSHILRCMHAAAIEARNTLDESADTRDNVVHVYATFDTADGVTAAKEMCRLARYRRGKPLPPNADAQVRAFTSDEPITCTWTDFMAIPDGRRAVLSYLAQSLSQLKAETFGDGIRLHVGNSGPIGEAELKQQAITVYNARLGVMNDSSDSDLIIALLMVMRLIVARAGAAGEEVPPVIIRSTFYVADTKVAPDAEPGDAPAVAPGALIDEGDEFFTGDAVLDAILASADDADLLDILGPRPAPAPAPPVAKAKRKMVREYVLVHKLWDAMQREYETMPETFALIALMMGSDLVPSVNGGAGSTIPGIGGRFAWDVWEEVAADLRPMVQQTIDIGNPQSAVIGDESTQGADSPMAPQPLSAPSPPPAQLTEPPAEVAEASAVEHYFRYTVSLRAVMRWLRAAYTKKIKSKMRFARDADTQRFVLPRWSDLIAVTADASARALRILDQQWALQVCLQAQYALNYYGMGVGSRDPVAKDDDGASLWGWTARRGATEPALAAEAYDAYSRWHGMPEMTDLHLSNANDAFGFGDEVSTLAFAPAWMAARSVRTATAKRTRKPAAAAGPPAKKPARVAIPPTPPPDDGPPAAAGPPPKRPVPDTEWGDDNFW
ncbi:MAG: hypothetical protein WC732_09995 [Candidatus Omnitrophota bacterium]